MDWIPAFAGMTCVSKGFPFQMTPLPSIGCCPNLNVAPPSWRLNAGWKPALHLKLGQHQALDLEAVRGTLWVDWEVQTEAQFSFFK